MVPPRRSDTYIIGDGNARVGRESKGRGGKVVTVVAELISAGFKAKKSGG